MLTEGFSVAVMEGMAAGLPVVSTAVGGQPELVGDRGLLVPPADAVALADTLERLLRDGDLAKEFGARARVWSCENLTVERMADQYMAVYEEFYAERAITSLR
jgi:glycosyltransferase involved in cell wall biosynthesis